MVRYLSKRPMLLCGILCSIVSLIGFYCAILLTVLLIVALIGLVLSFVKRVQPSINVCLVLVVMMIFSNIANNRRIERLEGLDSTVHTARLTIYEQSKECDGYCIAYAEVVESNTLEKGTKLHIYYDGNELDIGRTIEGEVKLSKIKEKYQKNYYSRGVYLSASVSSYAQNSQFDDKVVGFVGKIREHIKTVLFSNMGYSQASTMSALLFGESRYFTDEFYGNVKAAGVSHVMVVSGMHLSILVSLFTRITEKFFNNRYYKALCTVAVVVFMTALCGFTMSMLRAGITYLLMAAALLLKRNGLPENSLGAAVAAILIFLPTAVLNLAFRLSVLSTFGILVVALPIIKYVKENKLILFPPFLWLFSSVVISLSALMFTLPVAISAFGYISTMSVISCLLISTPATAAIWIAVTALAVEPILPIVGRLLFYVCEKIVAFINFCINKIGALWFSVVDVPQFAAYFAAANIIVILWALIACKKHNDMIKLEKIRKKIAEEGGRSLRWR